MLYAGEIGVILKSPEGDKMEYATRLQYQTTNNKAECEALLKGLELAKSLGVESTVVKGDFQLVINQVNGMCEAKEEQMKKYLNKVKWLIEKFKEASFVQVPREENMKADALVKAASARGIMDKTTMKTPTRETLFKLAYKIEAVIPAEVHMANHRVMKCFSIEDLILKRVTLATRNPAHGKLGSNWEGPYRVINCKRQGSYYLEALDARKLEHP
ncbi:uncharacterized protein LOC142620370 [Castanea sativa]|uniref:uncharacterized protein LOC142620370 n=1 Tax=Castanea sativa TaxID=21020 RepID=UPI003F64938A